MGACQSNIDPIEPKNKDAQSVLGVPSNAETASTMQNKEGGNHPVTEKIIEIHPDKKPTVELDDFVTIRDICNSQMCGPSFDCSKPEPGTRIRNTQIHAFIESIMLSYMHHLPLTLSPDDVWINIMQGFSIHMKQNSEKLRDKFVNFQGKKQLWVYRNDAYWFIKKHDWGGSFAEWSRKIKQNIGEKNYQNLVPKFSTTKELHQQVFDTQLMSSMEGYFEYMGGGLCGIPKIKMLGTLDDWETVRKRAESLDQYGCAHWIDALLPILDQFIATYKGQVDKDFWDMCVKMLPSYDSGGRFLDEFSRDTLTGWVLNFFPYNIDGEPQYAGLEELKEVYDKRAAGIPYAYDREMSEKYIPNSLSRVPFTYAEPSTGNQRQFKMTILTGFAGMSVDQDNFIRPQVAWSIHCVDGDPPKPVWKMDCEDGDRYLDYTGVPKKIKASAPLMEHIIKEDRDQILEWAEQANIDISHLTEAKSMIFGGDASRSSEDAIRDAWYRHEEVLGKVLIGDFMNERMRKRMEGRDMGEEIGQTKYGIDPKTNPVEFMAKRRKDYMRQRLDLYLTTAPEEEQKEIQGLLGEDGEFNDELVKIYNDRVLTLMKKKIELPSQNREDYPDEEGEGEYDEMGGGGPMEEGEDEQDEMGGGGGGY